MSLPNKTVNFVDVTHVTTPFFITFYINKGEQNFSDIYRHI